MARPSKAKPNRELGISIYPDPETRAMIDKMAEKENRPRSNMAIELIKRGLAKEKSNA